jgi:hypothetical protein
LGEGDTVVTDDYGSNEDLIYIRPIVEGYNERITKSRKSSKTVDLSKFTPVRSFRAHVNLDGGAGCSLVDSRFVDALGICAHSNVNSLNMAGFNGARTFGDHHVSLRIIIPGSIYVDGVDQPVTHEMQIQAIVVENLPVPLLLGASHLRRNNFQYPPGLTSEEKRIVTCGKRGISVPCDNIAAVREAEARRTIDGEAKESHIASVIPTVIPPHTAGLVKIDTNLAEGLWAAHTFEDNVEATSQGF